MENHYLKSNEAKLYLNNSTLLTKGIQTIKKEENNCNVNDNNSLNSEIISVSSDINSSCPVDYFTLAETGEFSEIMKQDIMLPSHLISNQETIERKEYSEREITYNLLLRRLVDEYLDRKITYSHQPKYILGVLKCVLERNFPEFSDSFHRERICAYLKACRRNAKRKNGEPYVRMSARYLSSGKASSLAETIYLKEHSYLNNMISSAKDNKLVAQAAPMSGYHEITENEIQNTNKLIHHQLQLHESHIQQVDPQITTHTTSYNDDNMKINNSYDIPVNSDEEIPTSLNSASQQNIDGIAFVKLLEQTAEFLQLIANRLDAGQEMFP
uniref:DNTTIP1_dimer domain-containing protein n=1 Tax=Schistosoma mansoni TaxID=6183 RepID=A0A3Q0KQL4_SCHMA